MATEKYESAFARNKTEVTREVDGKQVTFIRFRAVAKYRVANPDFVEKPEGEDTRTVTQKRREIWKQKSGLILEVPKGKGRKAEEQTITNITNALDTWRAELNAEASKPEQAKESVAEYGEAYIAMRESVDFDGMHKLERSTVLDYRKSLARLGSIGKVAMCDVTTKRVRDWERRQLEKGMSTYGVRKCHRLLHLIFEYAIKEEVVDANPVARVTPPSMPKKEPNSLTREGMQYVTAQLESMQTTPVVVASYIALHCGLRCAEACALRWRDVDFDAGTITVRHAIGVGKGGSYLKEPKTGKVRVVDFDTNQLADMLKRRRNMMLEQRDNCITGFDELYVCGNVDGGWAVPTVISRQWASLSSAWGLVGTSGERVNFHALRHSFVTAQLATGASVRDVADNAGHSSTQMTVDTYASALRTGKKAAAEHSGAYMRPNADAPIITLRATGTEG